jgi:uncharacterized membrane protein YkoI
MNMKAVIRSKPVLRRIFLLMLLPLSLTLSCGLFADDYKDARQLVESGQILPLEQILEKLPRQSQGTPLKALLEVKLKQKKKRWLYEIEVIDSQGVVREYLLDAADGRLLKEEIED